MSGLFAFPFPMLMILGCETKLNVGLHVVVMKKEFCNCDKIKLKNHCLKPWFCVSFVAFILSSH